MFDVHQHLPVSRRLHQTGVRRTLRVIFDFADGNQTLWTGAYLLSVLMHSRETQVNKALGALKGSVLHAESERGLPE